MRPKTATFGQRKKIRYSNRHWKLLKEKRDVAKKIMSQLEKAGLPSIVYGSVARGDVKEKSDVDIFIPINVPSYKLDLIIESWIERRVVQATPNYAIKGEFVIDNGVTVSFPLVRMKDRELDFYKFGGCLNLEQLKNNERCAGVDKRLVLINPTKEGHEEIPINEMSPKEVAKKLKVCVDIVLERIRVLERRRNVGRTGVFLLHQVPPYESFESTLKEIAKRKPAVRKLIEERGKI